MNNHSVSRSLACALLCLAFVACQPETTETCYVVYDGNGNTAGSVPAIKTYETGAVVTAAEVDTSFVSCPPGVEGRCFDAWNTEPDGSGSAYAAGTGTFIVHGSVTLYARWKEYSMGDTGPAGGVICYIKAVYSDGWRFLELSPLETEWSAKPWGGKGTAVTTGSAVGNGPQNTSDIVAALGPLEPLDNRPDYAARLCSELVYGGYDDWFLPSRDELLLARSADIDFGTGDFTVQPHWCSSSGLPVDAHTALYVDYSSGIVYPSSKDIGLFVRAIRRF